MQVPAKLKYYEFGWKQSVALSVLNTVHRDIKSSAHPCFFRATIALLLTANFITTIALNTPGNWAKSVNLPRLSENFPNLFRRIWVCSLEGRIMTEWKRRFTHE